MSKLVIKAMIAEYSSFQHAISANQAALAQARKDVIPTEVQVRLANIEDEFSGKEAVARQKSDELKAKIAYLMKALPAKDYATIREAGFMAVAKGGKIDTVMDAAILQKGLESLAINYPAVAPEIASILQMAKKETTTARSVALQPER